MINMIHNEIKLFHITTRYLQYTDIEWESNEYVHQQEITTQRSCSAELSKPRHSSHPVSDQENKSSKDRCELALNPQLLGLQHSTLTTATPEWLSTQEK